MQQPKRGIIFFVAFFIFYVTVVPMQFILLDISHIWRMIVISPLIFFTPVIVYILVTGKNFLILLQ